MGQYYKAINLDTKEYINPHDYDNGLKLMEHSYIGNDFTETVESLLAPGKPWHKTRLVWAGDYMDPGLFVDNEEDTLYSLSYEEFDKVKPKEESTKDYPYIVNHTKKEYVDKSKCEKDRYNFTVHPLPLLTSSGNGRGGGDYRYSGGEEYVGTWAGDVISIERDLSSLEDYKEIIPGFKEE